MGEEDRSQLIRELRAAASDLREGLRLWRESIAVRIEVDREMVELAKQRQSMARELQADTMEIHRAYRERLEEHRQLEKADYAARMENHRLWHEDHERSGRRPRPQGQSILRFLFCLIVVWFLLVSVYLLDWLSHHPSTVGIQ